MIFFGMVFGGCDKKVVYPAVTTINAPTLPILYNLIGYDGISIPDQGGYYSLTHSSDCFVIYCDYYPGRSGYWIYSFTIKFYAKNTGIYVLSNINTGKYYEYNVNNPPYSYNFSTDSIHTGIVTLTKLDTINHLLSGTFWYAAEEQSPTLNGGVDTLKNGYFTNLRW